MTGSRATSKRRNGVCSPVTSLFKGDSRVRTEAGRIDYLLGGELAAHAKVAVIARATDDQRWPDHASVTVQYR
ncbi:hypothetical protein [Nocardia beijingensis]|uniref:hypothetical protein n=1 Tax=Nocardia beijingensis TaxID=95162 RepID=UPI003F4D627D